MDLVVICVLIIGFFHKGVLFFRKELDNKQKTINNLLNIINYMHRNSKNLVIIFTKLQMLSLARLMQQLESDVFKRKIEITQQSYKDKRERKNITLSQTLSEGLRNEETQQHQDTENKSIITIENQLIEFRQKQPEKFKPSYII